MAVELRSPITGHSTAPPLCEAGHVLVVLAYYLPSPTGMSVTMHNLLSQFDPASYSIVTAGGLIKQGMSARDPSQRHEILFSLERLSRRLDVRAKEWQIPLAVSRLVRLIERRRPAAVVALYPSLIFLRIAREAAHRTGVPWIAYLHDTVAEGLSATRLREKAAELQAQVFEEATSVLVMSEGMAELYERKYGLDCLPLEHAYPEPIPAAPPTDEPLRRAFWGGAVYDINDRAVARVARALGAAGVPFRLTTTASPEELAGMGVTGDHVHTHFYPSRREYLEAVGQHGLLVLALNDADESQQHADELGTIFPTKTPEYLAAGRPILAHCPADSFLARYIEERGCGLVVSEPDEGALRAGIDFLLSGAPEVQRMQRAALEAARQFSPERVAARFQRVVRQVAAAPAAR